MLWYALRRDNRLMLIGAHVDKQAALEKARSMNLDFLNVFDEQTIQQWREVLDRGLQEAKHAARTASKGCSGGSVNAQEDDR